MMPPEEEEDATSSNQQEVPEAPSWPSAETSSTAVHHQEKLDKPPTSSRGTSHHSSSQRDRPGRSDDQYRSNRERDKSYRDRDRERDRDRDRDRERDRDRDRDRDRGRDSERDRSYRDRNYSSSRSRDSYRDREDRYDRRDRRDRRSRSPDERSSGGGGRRHSSRSRSRSKESRFRDARGQRPLSRDDRASSRETPRERVKQDRLSAEIEQELANLRRQHDLQEAAKKEQAKGKDVKKVNNKPKKLVPAFTVVKPEKKPDFVPYDVGLSATSDSAEYVPEIQTEEERIEFQRKMQEKLQLHLAAEGKLYPPPAKPKCEPAPPVAVSGFANDGSFLEMFKRLQEHQQQVVVAGVVTTSALPVAAVPLVPGTSHMLTLGTDASLVAPTTGVAAAGGVVSKISAAAQNPLIAAATFPAVLPGANSTPLAKPSMTEKEPPPPPLPVFGRRKGGKILKTGLVKKVRPIEESAAETPNDPWSLYLQEVKKYKSASCDADSKTRPLVK